MNELEILVNYIEKYKVLKKKYSKLKKLNDNLFLGWFYNKKFKSIEIEYNNLRYFLMLRYINNPITNNNQNSQFNQTQESNYTIPIAYQVDNN